MKHDKVHGRFGFGDKLDHLRGDRKGGYEPGSHGRLTEHVLLLEAPTAWMADHKMYAVLALQFPPYLRSSFHFKLFVFEVDLSVPQDVAQNIGVNLVDSDEGREGDDVGDVVGSHARGVDMELELLGQFPLLSFCSSQDRRLAGFSTERLRSPVAIVPNDGGDLGLISLSSLTRPF